MGETAETDARLVCAILAEQVSSLRNKMDVTAAFESLWQVSALLSRLGKILTQAEHQELEQVTSHAHLHELVAEITSTHKSLDNLAFIEAQRQDCAQQMADCVIAALKRLALTENPMETHFNPSDLETLYVSQDQHHLHKAVLTRMSPPSA